MKANIRIMNKSIRSVGVYFYLLFLVFFSTSLFVLLLTVIPH